MAIENRLVSVNMDVIATGSISVDSGSFAARQYHG
jgi:hypothetical protein